MTPLEEVLRNIDYVRCPGCHGSRVLPHGPCARCAGWGYVGDPADHEERIRLGLRAIWGNEVIETKRPKAKKPPPMKKRIRLRSRPPSRKRPR